MSLMALVAAMGLYLGIGLANLELPGLNNDEAFEAAHAIELLHRTPLRSESSIHAFGRDWPIMSTHIEGAFPAYLDAAAFAVFGVSTTTLRATQVVVGLIVFVLLWYIARTWFDDLTAVLAVVLCASSPPIVWWFRAGDLWRSWLPILALATMIALRSAWVSGDRRQLGLGALFFGLGVTTKILFVWLLAPVVLTLVLLPDRVKTVNRLTNFGLRGLVGGVLGSAAGLLPFLVHNFPDVPTIRFILSNVHQTELFGHRNLDLLTNLHSQVVDFLRVMGGDTLAYSAPTGLPVGAALFVAALVLSASRCLAAGAANMPDFAERLFLTLTIPAVIPLSTISTSHIGAGYLFFVLPFAWLLVAVSIRDLCERLAGRVPRRVGIAVVGMFVAVIVGYSTLMNVRVHESLQRTGGRGQWSDSIFRLTDVLESRYAGRPIIAMDWGFSRNVEVLTAGRLRPIEVYEHSLLPSPHFDEVSTRLSRDPDNVYLFHAPRHTAFHGRWEVFERSAKRLRKRIRKEEQLSDRTGEVVTLVYTVARE